MLKSRLSHAETPREKNTAPSDVCQETPMANLMLKWHLPDTIAHNGRKVGLQATRPKMHGPHAVCHMVWQSSSVMKTMATTATQKAH